MTDELSPDMIPEPAADPIPPPVVDAPSFTFNPQAPDAHPGVVRLISLLTGAILRGGEAPRIADRRIKAEGTLLYMPRVGKTPPPCAYELFAPIGPRGARLTVDACIVDPSRMVLGAGTGGQNIRGGDLYLGDILVLRGGAPCEAGSTNPYDCVAMVNGVPVLEEPRPEPEAPAEDTGAVLAETLEPPPFEGCSCVEGSEG